MNLEPNNDLIGPNEEWPYLNLLVDDYLNIEDEILEFDFQFMWWNIAANESISLLQKPMITNY